MKIGVLGLGYVGLANAAVLLKEGHTAIGYDINAEKVDSLNKGTYPFDEGVLAEVFQRKANKILFTTNIEELKNLDGYILSLPTPEKEDGSCNTEYMDEAINRLLPLLPKDMVSYLMIRSTVPLGYAKNLIEKIQNPKIHIISMPEFVREGSTFYDEEDPDRFVIGVNLDEDFEFVRRLRKVAYRKGVPFIRMNNSSAELSKYASNAFLALKISYINSLSRLTDKTDADIKDVALGMGSDRRIGKAMLGAGIGYGGSCFPKDTKAIVSFAKSHDVSLPLIEDTIRINEEQPQYFLSKAKEYLGDFKGKIIALFGLAYKNGIHDIRSSLSSVIIASLLKEGAILRCYDSSTYAMKAMKEKFPDIRCFSTMSLTLEGVDALMILTEDKKFLSLKDGPYLSKMKGDLIFDGRNLFKKEDLPLYRYHSLGRK